ncbi:MAG: transposase [Planctomycetota bacterium]
MPDYRRAKIDGGTYFFTVVTYGRRKIFNDTANRDLLGDIIREVKTRRPFVADAFVLLPDHLHAIWTLPPHDHDFSARWSEIKGSFTKAFMTRGGVDRAITKARRIEGRRGVWQPRFWEHAVRDEADFDRCFDYIHYNPVKHGLAESPADWPASSFRRWAEQGVYDIAWGRTTAPTSIAGTTGLFGEPE